MQSNIQPTFKNYVFNHYRENRKLVKFTKKNFKNRIVQQLEALEKEDPKQYWNLVNSLKDECNQNNDPELSIDSYSWSSYFQNLIAVQDKFKSRINDL